MVDSSEVEELEEVYKKMNTEGKKIMVGMAKNLLNAQLTGNNGYDQSGNKISLNMENKEVSV